MLTGSDAMDAACGTAGDPDRPNSTACIWHIGSCTLAASAPDHTAGTRYEHNSWTHSESPTPIRLWQKRVGGEAKGFQLAEATHWVGTVSSPYIVES